MTENRGTNAGRVLRFLFAVGPTTRAALARGLGLTRAAMTDLAGNLVSAGLLEEDRIEEASGRGRPGQLIRLRAAAAHFAGAEIGVERLVVTIIDLTGTVRRRVEERGSLVGLAPETVLRRLARLLRMAREGDRSLGPAAGLGVSVPGFMTRGGVVLSAPMLGWRDLDIAAAMRRRFDEPVLVENDANATAHGEWYFVPDHRRGDLMAVLLANGIGCGVITDGRLLRGSHGLAGELGHMPLIGAVRGENQWESRAGLRAAPSAETLATARDWPLWLARGLATGTYAYDPETIVVAGELTASFKARQQEVSAHLRRLLVPGFPMPKLMAARFGADGCAIGAASLVHARFIDQAEL